jgi:hypothetical protein
MINAEPVWVLEDRWTAVTATARSAHFGFGGHHGTRRSPHRERARLQAGAARARTAGLWRKAIEVEGTVLGRS